MAIFRRFSGPLILSAALRLFQLSRSSYGLDEMVSLNLAGQPGWAAAFADNNPPFYHFVLKLWIGVFGYGEWATRSLSVLFSVTATYFVMKTVEELRPQRSAVVAAGILHAVCVLSLAYGRDARMYAFFEMWMTISLYCFVGFFHGRRTLLPYVASCAAMAFTHYLAIVPLFVEFLVLCIAGRHLSGLKRAGLGAIFLALIAAQVWIYSHFFRWEGLQWQLVKSSAEPRSYWPTDLWMQLGNGNVVSALALTVGFFWAAFQTVSSDERERIPRLALMGMVLLPILGFSVGSLLSARALLLPRYFIFLVPPFCATVALLQPPRNPRIAALGLGVVVAGTLVGLWNLYVHRQEPWRDAAAIIRKFPSNAVFTTRTLALRTPYFERIGVPVVRLEMGSSRAVAQLSAEVAQGKRVWIVENFWGGYTYLPELKNTLTGLRLEVSELSIRDGDSPPVLMLEVEKKGT